MIPKPLRVAVVGAGAIGGFLAARLHLAGHQVAVVARGANYDAVHRHGIRLETDAAAEPAARVEALREIDDVGETDVLIVATKSHQVAAIAASLGRVAARSDLLVPVHNGVGWWYFQKLTGRFEGRAVHSVDPDGAVAQMVSTARAAPMFAFKSAEKMAPGVVRHIASPSDRFAIGALQPACAPQVQSFAKVLEASGIAAEVVDPRACMWTKLLGNGYANPICALTGESLDRIVSFAPTRQLALDLMREVADVAGAYGHDVAGDFGARLDRGAMLKGARPSMLQDREARRPMELDAILGALVELGALLDIPTPRTAALLACLRCIDIPATRLAGSPSGEKAAATARVAQT